MFLHVTDFFFNFFHRCLWAVMPLLLPQYQFPEMAPDVSMTPTQRHLAEGCSHIASFPWHPRTHLSTQDTPGGTGPTARLGNIVLASHRLELGFPCCINHHEIMHPRSSGDHRHGVLGQQLSEQAVFAFSSPTFPS